MRKCIAILLFCGVGMHAESLPSRTRKFFAASLAAVASAAAADTATSWGKAESNPVLGRSQFGIGQAGIKIGLVSAALASQYFLIRRHNAHLETGLAVVNFAGAGVLGAVAYHNSTIPRIAGGGPLK